ncbi:retrovirus-related Pol polyprotein from transposon TNT 1-94 [Trifolium pratense]|uniref:Retrovirus-related Pol polyprotein from transposon TNT 1-94 n=1 Tax=Trifolium pratense TaxID=57577 RepID=A0A2K3NCC8_TRIPR|nr:retrovirus-related Pol polyprotein from transposon TNT 1-94 [Trifolium pratense]
MAQTTPTLPLWHQRLGHPSSPPLLHALKTSNISFTGSSEKCIHCLSNKSHKLPFSKSSISSNNPLEIVYSDVWGPAPVYSIDDFRYYVIFIDHYSKYVWLYPMKFKSDVALLFPIFKNLVEKQFKTKIKTLYSDNGGEFIKLRSFLQNHGISHLTTPPHTPEHNGLSERKHRHLTETARCLLNQASLPTQFWSFAFLTAAYLINRLPTPGLNMSTPYHILFNHPPNYTKLKTFGCLCFPWLKPYTHNKLEPRSEPCIFLGYSLTQSAYICYNFKTHKTYISRHVQFVENIFPFSQNNTVVPSSTIIPLESPPTNTSLSSSIPVSQPILPTQPNTPNPTTDTQPPYPNISETLVTEPPSHSTPEHTLSTVQSVVEVPPPTPRPSGHSMATRSKNGIFKPKKLFLATKYPLPPSTEPTCVSQALQHAEWKQAMSDEFTALMNNGTWSLVPHHPHLNVIGNKWVFRIKRNPDGSIARYKARLVAKGFHQRPGIDYKDTFSPVIKPQTIKMVLCISLSKGWDLMQMDVNNAFLNGTLNEEVYMSQPPGFVHSSYPNHVCKLHKSLYGLKQAPRAWYNALHSFVVTYGFFKSKSDPSLFIYHKDGIMAYFLVYVDDLLLTGNSSSFLKDFKTTLAAKFSLKDMGNPSHFLGVELLPTSTGIFLSQQHYIRDILQKGNMLDAKPVCTPMATSTSVSSESNIPNCDATLYRSIIGSLHYLSITRPDVAFAVNKLSQHMQNPTTTHMQALKRILRYLKHTISHGLHLARNTSLTLTAFCDADWGGDNADRKSTGAYIVYLGSNAISWSCKKQPTVARSSTEAEYRTIGSTTTELLWLQQLLKELGIQISHTPTIFTDNIGANYLCVNPVFHTRMKHLAIDYHFVRDLVAKKELQVSHVPSSHQLADLLTKPLSRTRHEFLTSKIGVVEISSILRGHKGAIS